MNEDTKKTLKLGVFIILMCLFAASFFLWGLVNKGKLVLYGDAPFNVIVFGEDVDTECHESPCEITLSAGIHDVLLMKRGYRNILTEERVRTWRSTEVDLEFQIVPTLVEADTMPISPRKPTYEIVDDRATGTQKLIDTDDERRRALAHFQRILTDPKIFGDERFVLVVGREIYKIDTENNTREEMGELDLTGIRDVKWSMDGRYMIFEREDSPNLWIVDTENGETKELTITNLGLTDWLYNNTLIFMTNQDSTTAIGTDEEGYSHVEFTGEISTKGYTLGFYYPVRNRYSRVETFDRITSEPEEFIALANGQSVYLKLNGEKFRIILRKF